MLLWLGLDDGRVSTTRFRVPVTAQDYLVGRVYVPTSTQMPYPSIILCHGVRSSKDTMSSLAFELARRGIAAVTFDFGGAGQSYRRPQSQLDNQRDAEKILAWVRQQTPLDPQRIGIGGHSMGGTTALELAKANPQLQSTIILGIGGEATPTSPRNLLFGSGVYEELNPVSEMRLFLAQAVGKEAKESEEFGDFTKGTARSLVLSSSADHFLAPYNPVLLQAAVTWAEQSFNLPQSNLPIVSHWRIKGIVLSFGGATALSIYVYRRVLSRSIDRKLLLIKIAIAGSAIAILVMLLPASIGKSIEIGCLVALCCGNYGLSDAGKLETASRKILLYGAVIYLAFIVGVFVQSWVSGSLLGVSRAIVGFPYLVFSFPFNFFYNLFDLLSDFLSSLPGFIVAAIWVAIEAVKPGIVFLSCEVLLSKIIRFVRQPFYLNWERSSPSKFILFLVLLSVFGAILWHQQQSGLLTGEAIEFVLKLLAVFAILPGAIVIAIIRSCWFQRIEARLEVSGLRKEADC